MLAGCAADRPPVPPPRYAAGAACYAALAPDEVRWTQAASPSRRRGCGIADPLRVEAAGGAVLERPALVDCRLATALAAFTREVVQPEAVRHFGQPVLRMSHLGAWDCRPRTGSLFRMSEHASGRALDLAGFELADGRRISVARDWNRGRAGRFLRAVATGACRYFSIVLTPETDRNHRDHFHLDLGPYRVCD